jgi:hypothetical protein
MAGSAVDTVTELLQNLGNPEVVRRLVATDAVYVSLNQDNPELKQILPWAGTDHGPSSFTDALGMMFTGGRMNSSSRQTSSATTTEQRYSAPSGTAHTPSTR